MALLHLMLTWRHLMSKEKIYESPDGGKTVYERDFGAPHSERTLIVGNDDYMTDSISVDLSMHLDEMGVVDMDGYKLTSHTPTVTVDTSDDYFNLTASEQDQLLDELNDGPSKKKLPKSLHKKYGL